MATILKKESADKMAFDFLPQKIRLGPSDAAKSFVSQQATKESGFKIADVIAQQSGVKELQRKNIETQVDETVLVKIKEIEEKAYNKAYQLGLEEGRKQAVTEEKENINAQVEQYSIINTSMDQAMTEMMKENEITISKLIFSIARRIAHREIDGDRYPVVELLKKLVEEVQSATHVVIRLSIEDFALIEDLKNKSDKNVQPLLRAKIEAAPTVTNGGCVIETEFGAIDATVEQRVEAAWKAIEARLPNLNSQKTP